MSPPTVAVIGSAGYVGKCLMPTFLDALKDGKLKELRVLTSEAKLTSEQIQSYVASGAKAFAVDYAETSTVTTALNDVDVAVSALGTKDGVESVRSTLLDALVEAKVKVYFPSEFGTNHYKIKNYQHPVFAGKQEHFEKAKERGLNPIRILCNDIIEGTFGKWFGLDCVSGVWTVVENADVQVAMTAERDVARYTLEAVLLAHSDLAKCPDALEVYSDMKTLREYAKAFDKVSGKEIKVEVVPLEEFKKEYEESNEFVKLIMILFGDGTFDYTDATGNQLLNPNESVWKLKKIEEYAEETGGVPWKE